MNKLLTHTHTRTTHGKNSACKKQSARQFSQRRVKVTVGNALARLPLKSQQERDKDMEEGMGEEEKWERGVKVGGGGAVAVDHRQPSNETRTRTRHYLSCVPYGGYFGD